MSTLARIRRVPVSASTTPSADLVRLREVYRQAREHDSIAYDLRREGEEIIRAAFAQGVSVRMLAAIAELKSARIYQVLGGPTVVGASPPDAVEDEHGHRNGERTG